MVYQGQKLEIIYIIKHRYVYSCFSRQKPENLRAFPTTDETGFELPPIDYCSRREKD